MQFWKDSYFFFMDFFFDLQQKLNDFISPHYSIDQFVPCGSTWYISSLDSTLSDPLILIITFPIVGSMSFKTKK